VDAVLVGSLGRLNVKSVRMKCAESARLCFMVRLVNVVRLMILKNGLGMLVEILLEIARIVKS
jgi:hypothetical protein